MRPQDIRYARVDIGLRPARIGLQDVRMLYPRVIIGLRPAHIELRPVDIRYARVAIRYPPARIGCPDECTAKGARHITFLDSDLTKILTNHAEDKLNCLADVGKSFLLSVPCRS